MKPDTLIILSPGFPGSEAESTCLPSLQSLVKTIKETRPRLRVIVIALQYPYTAGEYDWHECRVIALGGKGRSKLFRLLLWRKAWAILKKIEKNNTIKGILSFWCGEAALIGHRFGKKCETLHYCYILGQDAKKDNRYVQRIKPSPGELIAISDFIRKEFKKNHGIEPQQVIPLGIDPSQFPQKDKGRDIDVLGAGSLIPLKQYDVFIDVISELKEQWPQIKAVVCGKGPKEKRLKEMIEKQDLRNNITLAGELPHAEVLQHMQRSRLFLHTSGYEGFGVVCIEALYAGVPVISFCKPTEGTIPNWHIVQTKEEMTHLAMTILKNAPRQYDPVIPFTIKKTVEEVLQLFGQ